MLTHHRLQLRQSEIREKLNNLVAKDSLTDDERSDLETLSNEMRDLEPRLRAALLAQEEANREDPKLGEVKSRASLGDYVDALLVHRRALDGAAAEWNKELGLDGNAIPWEAFDTPVEHRAATTTSQNDGSTMQRPILQRLFARDVFDALGVRLDSVGAGESEYVLLTTGPAPAMKAEGTAATAATASSFMMTTLRPKRLTAQIEYSREVMASVAGIEQSLRTDLLSSMRDQMNAQILTGAGVANVDGIFHRISKPGVPSAVVSYENILSTPAEMVDGIHANSSGEIGVLMAPDAYRKASAIFQSGSGESAIMGLGRVARSVMVSAHVPAAPTSSTRANVADLVLSASSVPGAHVAAIWQGVSLITDELSLADKGQVRVTAYALWDAYTVFRSGATKLVSWKIA